MERGIGGAVAEIAAVVQIREAGPVDRLEFLRRHFGEQTRIAGLAAGLHLAWTPPPHLGAADAIAAAALRVGLDADWVDDRVVLLGFGAGSECQSEAGVEALAKALAVPGGLVGQAGSGSAASDRLVGDRPVGDCPLADGGSASRGARSGHAIGCG